VSVESAWMATPVTATQVATAITEIAQMRRATVYVIPGMLGPCVVDGEADVGSIGGAGRNLSRARARGRRPCGDPHGAYGAARPLSL